MHNDATRTILVSNDFPRGLGTHNNIMNQTKRYLFIVVQNISFKISKRFCQKKLNLCHSSIKRHDPITIEVLGLWCLTQLSTIFIGKRACPLHYSSYNLIGKRTCPLHYSSYNLIGKRTCPLHYIESIEIYL
jgi:hypothetical protein